MEQDVKAGASPQVPQAMLPRCQYCGTDPASLSPAFLMMPGIGRIVVFMCGSCRAIHTAHLMSTPDVPQNGRPSPLIVVP